MTDEVIRWALSYKMSYDTVKEAMLEAHETAVRMEDALTRIRKDLDTV